jgi:hypothetical protein
VSFILRSANSLLLKKVIELLRQEYPNLTTETLRADFEEARAINRALALSLNGFSGNALAGKSGVGFHHSLPSWHHCDPLVLADDFSLQLSGCQWLLLSEDPAMPLALPGNGGRRSSGGATGDSDLKASPLRLLIESLAGLKPGEIACSQLLVWGTVSKEWVKYKERQILAISPDATPASQGRSTNAKTRISQPRSSGSGGYTNPATSNEANLKLMMILAIGLYLFWAGFNSWQELRKLLKEADLAELTPWIGLRVLLAIGILILGTVIWWIFFHQRGNKDELISSSAMEEKFSSPLGLAGIRQTISIPFEFHLDRVCLDEDLKPSFVAAGFDQAVAANLLRLRKGWLAQTSPGLAPESKLISKAANQPDLLRQKLVEVDNLDNHRLWEFVVKLAGTLVEERLDDLKNGLSSAYASYNNLSGNAFTVVPGKEAAAQSYSSLLPYDWSSPERVRRSGLDSIWPFNTPLFDWVSDQFNRELPPEVKEHHGLQIFNTLELSYLWHLPGGYEGFEFVERTGPKTMGPPPSLFGRTGNLLRPEIIKNKPGEIEKEFTPLADQGASGNANPPTPGNGHNQEPQGELPSDPLFGLDDQF